MDYETAEEVEHSCEVRLEPAQQVDVVAIKPERNAEDLRALRDVFVCFDEVNYRSPDDLANMQRCAVVQKVTPEEIKVELPTPQPRVAVAVSAPAPSALLGSEEPYYDLPEDGLS
jgi:hypothetical protein